MPEFFIIEIQSEYVGKYDPCTRLTHMRLMISRTRFRNFPFRRCNSFCCAFEKMIWVSFTHSVILLTPHILWLHQLDRFYWNSKLSLAKYQSYICYCSEFSVSHVFNLVAFTGNWGSSVFICLFLTISYFLRMLSAFKDKIYYFRPNIHKASVCCITIICC